jgi:hypothetical protein
MLKSATLYPALQEGIGPEGLFMPEYRIELYRTSRKYDPLETVHIYVQAVTA